MKAVSVNLGCASPSAVGNERRAAAVGWAESARADGADLVFAQEVPDDAWLAAWEDGFTVMPVSSPRFRVVSALISRFPVEPLDLATQNYHGSYVSGALIRLPGIDRPIAVLSVHASPAVVSPDDLQRWRDLRSEPVARVGGGRDSGRLFDADMVLNTCVSLVEQGHPVLAAGDLNECLAWDDVHGESWGRLFHNRAADGGLVMSLHRLWAEERRTLFQPGRQPYQLDHVLATPDVDALITEAHVDGAWNESDVETGARSDHAPVWFELEDDRAR